MRQFSGGIPVTGIVSRKALHDFIIDFKLRQPNGVICFYAKIEFDILDHKVSKLCEVQIITSDNLDTIYLIDPTLDPFFLPDIFKAATEQFMYIPQKGLAVHCPQSERFGEYNVFIFP